jgi:hypothetical protein
MAAILRYWTRSPIVFFCLKHRHGNQCLHNQHWNIYGWEDGVLHNKGCFASAEYQALARSRLLDMVISTAVKVCIYDLWIYWDILLVLVVWMTWILVTYTPAKAKFTFNGIDMIYSISDFPKDHVLVFKRC